MKLIPFSNQGYMLARLNDQDLSPVWDEVIKIQSDFTYGEPNQHNLVGNIEHEYNLQDSHSHIERIIIPYVFEYEKNVNLFARNRINATNDVDIKLDNVWVNFQKKHEFNPPHNHSGVYSFVIWLRVPYDMEEEKKNPSGLRSKGNSPGHFCLQTFDTTNTLDTIVLPVDKKWNGMMCLFPAKTPHYVNPFYTSDDYRISVAGNFYYRPIY